VAKRRFARRLPRALAVTEPGGLFQLDTVFVNLTPTKAIKHFTAYDPIAKWTVGKAFNAPRRRPRQPSSTKSSPTCHSP
jgi:putative transposase